MQTKFFCYIFQKHGDHSTKYCPFNMKNGKESWCAIYETKNHNMADYHMNLKNRQNYHVVYQTNVVAQSNDQNHAPNDQNNQRYENWYDNRRGCYGGRGQFFGNRDN